MEHPILLYPSAAVGIDKDSHDDDNVEVTPFSSSSSSSWHYHHQNDEHLKSNWWRQPSNTAMTVAIVVIILVQFQGPIKRWLNRLCCRILVDSNGVVVPWQDLFWMLLDGMRGRSQAFLEYTRQQLHQDWMHHLVTAHAPPEDDDDVGYECENDRVNRIAANSGNSKSGVLLLPAERRKRGDSLPALEVVAAPQEEVEGEREHKKAPRKRRHCNGNGTRRLNDEELEPAFLNENDYPPGWMVYHPVLGVVSKVVADQYDRGVSLNEQKQGVVSVDGASAVDGNDDAENSISGYPQSASSTTSTPPPSTILASG